MIVPIKIKALAANQEHTWEDKIAALKTCAQFIQMLNMSPDFLPFLVNGPLQSNPDSEIIEGYLGAVNTIPNEFGICNIAVENYDGLQIPFWPVEAPFYTYWGDTSEQKQTGVDAEGNPVYETIYAGTIAE